MPLCMLHALAACMLDAGCWSVPCTSKPARKPPPATHQQELRPPAIRPTLPQVRALAEAAALATQARRDSQGICFLGKVKFGEFVKEHLGEWPGPIVEQVGGYSMNA